jgi:hypothetical protein
MCGVSAIESKKYTVFAKGISIKRNIKERIGIEKQKQRETDV